MDKLIYRETKVVTPLATKHPRVLSIWETGSTTKEKNAPLFYNIHILLKDGGRQEFRGENPEKVLEEAEAYLQSINNML